jgi:transposase
MANRRIEMYEYRRIIYRLKKEEGVRTIARDGLAGREKIRHIKKVSLEYGWLEPGSSLPDEAVLKEIFTQRERSVQSKAAPYAELIEKWVKEGVQGKVIHQHLQAYHSYDGSYNSLQRFVKKIKAQSPQLTVPLNFQPGEAAQVDFGAGPVLFDERTGKNEKTWFFIMTLCWSRHQYVELVTHQDIETWLNCHQNAFEWFGGVVRKVIIDNPKCAITKACYYDPQVQRSYANLAESYGFIISACPPRDPKKKGRVESGVKYVKKNFVPLRHFKNLQDANVQLKQWVLGTAGNRHHGSTHQKPLSQFTEIERYQLTPLPEHPPEIASWYKVTPYKNCHVRHNKNFYSVPYSCYGKPLWLKQTVTTVNIYHEHTLIAMHARLLGQGDFSTNNDHLPDNARYYYLQRDANWCVKESKLIGECTEEVVTLLLTDPVRDLLRAAQGVIQLEKRYGKARLENACKRAIYFNSISLKTIKKILEAGLDAQPIGAPSQGETLQTVYQGGGTYQRQQTTL